VAARALGAADHGVGGACPLILSSGDPAYRSAVLNTLAPRGSPPGAQCRECAARAAADHRLGGGDRGRAADAGRASARDIRRARHGAGAGRGGAVGRRARQPVADRADRADHAADRAALRLPGAAARDARVHGRCAGAGGARVLGRDAG
jgi:hypothetical protein